MPIADYSATRLRLTDDEKEAVISALDQHVRYTAGLEGDDSSSWSALHKFQAIVGVPYTERES